MAVDVRDAAACVDVPNSQAPPARSVHFVTNRFDSVNLLAVGVLDRVYDTPATGAVFLSSANKTISLINTSASSELTLIAR